MATGNMYREFRDVWICAFLRHANRQTDRQTDRHTDKLTYRHADRNTSQLYILVY